MAEELINVVAHDFKALTKDYRVRSFRMFAMTGTTSVFVCFFWSLVFVQYFQAYRLLSVIFI